MIASQKDCIKNLVAACTGEQVAWANDPQGWVDDPFIELSIVGSTAQDLFGEAFGDVGSEYSRMEKVTVNAAITSQVSGKAIEVAMLLCLMLPSRSASLMALESANGVSVISADTGNSVSLPAEDGAMLEAIGCTLVFSIGNKIVDSSTAGEYIETVEISGEADSLEVIISTED